MTYIEPASKLLQHLDRLSDLKAGRTPAPINVEVDLSNRCSLGCEWCHFAFTHTRGPLAGKRPKPEGAVAGGDLMDAELAKVMVGEFVDAGVRSVTWTGGGEPTLHPRFDRIVRFTEESGLPQGLYTHGGHIDEERAAVLKRALTFVYVSLDAADAVSYLRDKGVDRFADACNGIRRLVAADGDATVGCGFLITRHNFWQAPQMAALARELGADYAQFRPTVLYNQDSPGLPAEDTAWMLEARPVLEALAARADVEVDLDRFDLYRDWGGHGYQTCWWSGLQTVVTPNGSVWTCVNKREHPASLLGSLADESFEDIWARRPLAKVDGSCRIACRGHVPNRALDQMMRPAAHAAFV